MPEWPAETPIFWIWAEYCSGPFYVGWWLYEREHLDFTKKRPGRRHNKSGSWGWIRAGCNIERVARLCLGLGHGDMPGVTRYGDAFAEEFNKRFPKGIKVRRVRGDCRHEYEPVQLAEVADG